jgi:hypothetical protein
MANARVAGFDAHFLITGYAADAGPSHWHYCARAAGAVAFINPKPVINLNPGGSAFATPAGTSCRIRGRWRAGAQRARDGPLRQQIWRENEGGRQKNKRRNGEESQ